MNRVKPFHSIPGPSSWPMFGTLPYYLWGPIKKYDFKRLDKNGLSKYNEFGPIVRENIAPGTNIVWLFDPDDIQKMFQYDGQCPARRSHLALQKYRRDRPHLPLNVPKALDIFQDPFQGIASEFVETISPGTQEDFLEDLKRYFVEITGFFTLDTRLGALSQDGKNENSLSSILIRSAFQTNSNILLTDNSLPLWKIFETKEYKALRESQGQIEMIALEFIRSKKESLSRKDKTDKYTLLDHYFITDNLDEKDILAMVCDSLLAGIDTSSYTSGFMLYHLAKNPETQAHLRDTIKSLPEQGLKGFSYGRAVLKGNTSSQSRFRGDRKDLPEPNAIFSGYSVPEGTVLVSQNQVSCRLKEYFEDPLDFRPERWLNKTQKTHPYLILPFGFGPRMCIGRRIAEMSILHLLKELIMKYEIELRDPGLELGCISYLINSPDQPLCLEFKKIKY
ncbi:Cytochrome P450 302a1_ mitochondrial [Caligus rogercresseyi]|uniref:Cytochrome P450 302a1_ mitochondrial n=1 Tax=Caligus rogercresseyi TaxID=217165 RepID=A0A7T8HH41_CALRO|nr:Cytochrome P450 302a1_ mitochondrial [Caligus rogercresseyi]